ncbi:MAG: hypothetical protein HY547_03080 [Elusimicrobia bacterium]|nr:hypothetical protein [Elusimicrobiota bacterium]
MNGEFHTLFDHLKNLRGRYFNALCSFRVFRSLEDLGGTNIVGEDHAHKNVATMNKFKGFFIPSKEALRAHSLLELAKIFDHSDESLHIKKIVNYAQGNMKKLTRADFLAFHQSRGRKFLDELFNQYEEMNSQDLQQIKTKLERHDGVLKRLKDYRDQYLAHDDVKRQEITITRGEVEALLELAKEILDAFSLKLDFSSTVYDLAEEDCKNHTAQVVEHLHRFEPYRLKEIRPKRGLP